MLQKISVNITNRLVRTHVINEEDFDIYQFGLERLFAQILNIITTILLGLAFGMLLECFVFLVAFIALRTYAGGCHATTPRKCYIWTTLIVAASLSAIKYIPENIFIYVALLFVASSIIVILSPVSSENKVLDAVEKKIYRRKTYIRWGIETIIVILCMLFNMREISICIIVAQVVTSISQFVEILKNNQYSREMNVNHEYR